MFDVSIQLLIQLINLLPYILGIWLIFDLVGALLFGKG